MWKELCCAWILNNLVWDTVLVKSYLVHIGWIIEQKKKSSSGKTCGLKHFIYSTFKYWTVIWGLNSRSERKLSINLSLTLYMAVSRKCTWNINEHLVLAELQHVPLWEYRRGFQHVCDNVWMERTQLVWGPRH